MANLPRPLAARNINLVAGRVLRVMVVPRDCCDFLAIARPADLLMRRLAPSLGLDRPLFAAAFFHRIRGPLELFDLIVIGFNVGILKMNLRMKFND